MTDLRIGLENVRMPNTGEPATGLSDAELYNIYVRMGRDDKSSWGQELAERRITRDGLRLKPEEYAAYVRISNRGETQKHWPVQSQRQCPRCGSYNMKRLLYANALSRLADIFVCDMCGIDEAVRSQPGNPAGILPFRDWYVEREDKPDA